MSDFNIIMDYCKLFLKNSITFNDSGSFENFAFLLRTEVLFEDFVSNFVKEKFPDKTIIAQQQSDLDDKGHFHIKPDLIIKSGNNVEKIIDIKYKDIKNGYNSISQADIYQCVTYAVKKNCNDVTLLYPIFNKKNVSLENITINDITIHFVFIDCCSANEETLKNNIDGKLFSEETEKNKTPT